MNKTYSDFLNISFGVRQGYTVGPVLFDIFSNESFYFIFMASAKSFGDNKSFSLLITILKNYFD